MLDLSHMIDGEVKKTSPSPRPKIMSWSIRIYYEDGTVENLAELPNEVAETIDRHLDTLD